MAWRWMTDVGEFTGGPNSALLSLTARESQIASLISKGLDNAQIAARLGISD